MELRVHGIGGSDPERVLGGDAGSSVVSWRSEARTRSVVRCLAGDRKVHVYHWSPLTSGSRSFALWPLLLPFTLVNVAGWMAPPGKHAVRRTLHWAGTVWVGLATTAATVAWLLLAALAVWREVSGYGEGGAPVGVSAWYFVAIASSAALAMSALVLMATYTASGFERFRPTSWLHKGRAWRWPWGVGSSIRLDDQRFYDNAEEHKVRWRIHVAVAVLTFAAVVSLVFVIGTERAGHVIGRSLVAVGVAQAVGVALIAAAGLSPDSDDPRRYTRRLLGAATALLGIMLLGGVTLSALISFTGIDEVPRGPVAVLYDCYGWAVLAGIGCAILCVVFTVLSPVPAETGAARSLVPTVSARLRARLATVLEHVDRVVTVTALAFAVAAVVAVVRRWSSLGDDSWRLTATPPVNLARSTFAFVVAFTVLNLVKSRASPESLRRIGNVWDILTFWPRAFHPFAVRPYAERAVPELQEFILTAPRDGELVLATHSQGSVLAYAAIRPLLVKPDRALPPFRLVTFGSPLRALHTEVFPYYFRSDEITKTRNEISGGWVNCFRFTDHVGRALFEDDGEAASAYGADRDRPDRPIADALLPNSKVNGHNDYWMEPVVRRAVGAVGQEGADG